MFCTLCTNVYKQVFIKRKKAQYIVETAQSKALYIVCYAVRFFKRVTSYAKRSSINVPVCYKVRLKRTRNAL